jgi:hypothetical protein
MTDREKELDALLSELADTEPEPRDELSERARRRRVAAVIDDRIARHEQPEPRAARAPRRTWLLLGAAAAVLLSASVVLSFRQRSLALLEPERWGASPRPQTPALAPAPAQPPLESPPQRPPARSPERARAVASRVEAATSSRAEAAGGVPSGSASSGVSPTGATLGAQNDLFQSAVRSQRRGDDEGALAQFDALLTRFPDAPLAADARVRKFRTLARLGRSTEARAAASDYVTRHPEGFARSEAQALLAGAPTHENTGAP